MNFYRTLMTSSYKMKQSARHDFPMVLALSAVLSMSLALSCTKGLFGTSGITFSARSSVPDITKTAYGEVSGSQYSINWEDGDIIRIYSPQASLLDGATHYADYSVASHTESGVVSTAAITPADKNGLQWGTGEHGFYGIYPSPATSGMSSLVSINESSCSFSFPASQTAGDMRYAYMYAKSTGISPGSASIPLTFEPKFTSFSFTIDRGEYTGVILESLTLHSGDSSLNGECTLTHSTGAVTCPAYSAGLNDSVTATEVDASLSSTTGSVTVLLFVPPHDVGQMTLSVVLNIGTDASPVRVTRSLKLQQNGNWISFTGGKCYLLSGISLQKFDRADGTGITWDGTYNQLFGTEISWTDSDAYSDSDAEKLSWKE